MSAPKRIYLQAASSLGGWTLATWCGERVSEADEAYDHESVNAELRALALDCWNQWAYKTSDGQRHDGGLSALEDLYELLLNAGAITADGRTATGKGES